MDFGRAPASTYERWSQQAACRVISLFDFAEEIEDLRRIKGLLQLGMGQIVDRFGIDWWDVTSVLIVPELLQLMLVRRLAQELGVPCELYCTRLHPLIEALHLLNGGNLHNLKTSFQLRIRRVRHYSDVLSKLDAAQMSQVVKDKFDPEHAIRRRFAFRRPSSGQRVVLLPSNYINVSRMAVSYAAMLPNEQFLLVLARSVGRLSPLPENVRMTSLDAYFSSSNQAEITLLLHLWGAVKDRLISGAEEFATADAGGMLGRIPALLRSGVAARNAWNQVYESENVGACLSTDDGVPYTRIPLILGKSRGLPTLACHHGALDCLMTIKTQYADFQLAKGEMEEDYLLRVCGIASEKIIMGGPASGTAYRSEPIPRWSDRCWLVFFTEPYACDAWHADEVYRDLLPRLTALARFCGLKLVFKVHPFESVKSVRRLLRRYLPRDQEREIHVIAGPTSHEIWRHTRFALTAQSSVALESKALGIPIFLCAWLRDPYSAYLKQFERFGVGYVLHSPEQIADIPGLLERKAAEPLESSPMEPIDPGKLQALLHGAYSVEPH